jgi:opacity protein-like surface antigen
MFTQGALGTLAAIVLTIAAVSANAQGSNGGGDYVAVRLVGSVSSIDNLEDSRNGSIQRAHDFDQTGGGGFAIGYDWSGKGLPVRTELEYHYRHRFDLDLRAVGGSNRGIKNNLQTHYALVSAVYDIDLSQSWKLYIGGGIGATMNVSNVEARDLATSAIVESEDTKTNFAWSGMLGATYAFNANWKLEMGYRYSDLGSVVMGPFTNGGEVTADYSSHDIILGVQYHF